MTKAPHSDHPAHVVTGATGFVGSAIVLELLQRTDAKIIGIVRAANDDAATARLRGVLAPLVEAYGLPPSALTDVDHRVTAVAGDIEQEHCGTEAKSEIRGAEFWHSAASLRFLDRHWDQIRRTNIGGTGNAIELAKRMECSRFNMISTAYVAGYRSGVVMEEPAVPGFANNRYEESKVAAEHLVTASGLEARIMRPGVVIGHSGSHHTTSDDGVYGFVRSLIKFRGVLERTQSGLGQRRRIAMVGDESATLDLIPVDHVAAEAVALSIADADSRYYHLTNPAAPSTGDLIRQAFLSAGLLAPEIVDDPSGFDSMERKLHKRLMFYSSYFVNPKHFDRGAVHQALGRTDSPGFPMPADLLGQFCNWYAERFERSRPLLPAVR